VSASSAFVLLLLGSLPVFGQLNYDRMAERIVKSLALTKGERVIVRYDPGYFAEMTAPIEKRIASAGAVVAAKLEYLEPSKADGGRLAELLKNADVYLWMPLREGVRYVSPAEQEALTKWLDAGGAHREIHFHWSQGSVLADGLTTAHPVEFDRLYQDALDIDYAALRGTQDKIEAALRSGALRIQTPAGTDLRLQVGDRPMNKQDGDASARRMKSAKVRVDREVELPAGVVRVAPEEKLVSGVIVNPEARFGGAIARGIRLVVTHGRITNVSAAENLAAVEAELKKGGSAAMQFREIGIGANPKLAAIPGNKSLPYFGYGAGVLRMSLGDNEELGGAVRGNYRRWFFFPDATITCGGKMLVRDGKLTIE
jgi:hypothetical protein